MSYRDLPLGGLGDRWREFARQRPWLKGYNACYFPHARGWLRHRTGMHFFEQEHSKGHGRYMLAAYHPTESITWIFVLDWLVPHWRRLLAFSYVRQRHNSGTNTHLALGPLGTFYLNTQHRMLRRREPPPVYRCVRGHDLCGQMTSGPECPYCERLH